MRAAALCLAALLLLSAACLAQDTDADGIPDAVEIDLGSDPARAEEFVLQFHDGVIGQDDESVSDRYEAAPDFVDVYLANVAQDRWLWKITFTEHYVGETNTFILYLDVDGSLETGRQDAEWVRGTDLMYTQVNGDFSLSQHTEGIVQDPLRMAPVGDAMYICADLPLGEGPGPPRFRVLSHVSPPKDYDSDSTDFMVVELPERRDAEKPRIGAPCELAPVAELSTNQPDGDGDGIADMVETVLGMDTGHADTLHLIIEDGSAAEGEQMSSAFERANDVTDVYFGNAAGDRWVWRIDFADEFDSGGGTLVILYLDCDNNRATGRQDKGSVRGTDIMLTCGDGSFGASIRNPDVLSEDRTVRGYIDGSTIYYSMDLQLNQNEEGHSEYRAYVLSQYRPTGGDADSTDWVTVCGPGESARTKPRVGCVSEMLSEGVHVESPWLYWREQLREMEAVRVDLTSAELSEMHLEDRSLVADAEAATAAVTSPVAGEYHLNVVLQDSPERREEIELRVGGETVARMVAAENDGLIHVFSTPEPVALEQARPIEFVCDGPAQDGRISELTLTRSMLEPRGLAIHNVEVFCAPDQRGDRVDVDVCFLTNMPRTARVQWGSGDELDRLAEDESATYNHRVRLEGLERGATYRFRALAGSGAGEVASDVRSFVAEPLRPERCGVERARVELSVLDPIKQRPAWPVSGGIPIPRGHLRDAGHCRVLHDGEPVAADFAELAWWPDGSVKWLLVSLVHEAGRYTLEYGEQVERPAVERPIRVEDTPQGLRVTTDILQADLSRERFSPPGELWRDLDGDGRFTDAERITTPGDGALLVDAEGNSYSTAGQAVERLEVEEAGPVRTVILAEGRFAGEAGELLSYRCRLYFYRGFAGVPTVFTLIGDEGDAIQPPTMTPIRSLTVPVQFAHEFTEADFLPLPDDPEQRRTVEKARDMVLAGTRMLHDYDDRYIVTRGDRVEEHDGHTNAAVGLAYEDDGRRRSIAVTMRDFWQMYPKAYSAQGSRIVAEIFPELPADQYADEDLTPFERTRHYYWCREGTYQIPMGVALSYDLLFYCFDDTEAKEIMDEAWDNIPLLTPGPEFYCVSGAFGDVEPELPGVFESYQRWIDEGFEGMEERRQRVREYDWMNFGDTHGERWVNWTNQEYDLQWGLLVQFARSGDWRYFDRAEEAARHTAAVDTINVAPTESLLGIQKAHCLGHTGGFEMERPENAQYWFKDGIWNTGHMWSQGTLTAYCLTGDRRYLDSGMLLVEWMAREEARHVSKWVHRAQGWTTIASLGGYHVVPHPWYLNAARLFSQNAISRQDPGTGAFIHGIGECEHEVRHMGGKAFMTGVVMTGMRMLDQIDPDEDLKNSVVRSADWLHWRMWHPWDNSFQYAQCTQYDGSSTHAGTYMACEGIAWAYDLAGEPVYREMLVRSLGDMIVNRAPSTSGKGYAMQIRMTPYALSAMQHWGMTELPAPPPPEPEIGMGGTVYLPAERPGLLAVSVNNRGRQPIEAEAEIVALPGGLSAEPARVTWTAQPGANLGPAFALTGAGEGQVAVRCRAAETEETLTASLRAQRHIEVGEGLAIVSGEDDTVAAALGRLGIDIEPVADLSPETLAEYGALLVGREGHEKDYGGLREDWPMLLDFVASGGRVALVQLQNTSYEIGYLPLPLRLSDQSGALGEIAAPDHPIFTRPNAIESLAGVISYDTIVGADEGWTVLARDDSGNPSIVETAFGDGRVLVVQPSPDRYVVGEETPEGGLTAEACGRFLANVVEWLGAH